MRVGYALRHRQMMCLVVRALCNQPGEPATEAEQRGRNSGEALRDGRA
jgi:hypothetical protein